MTREKIDCWLVHDFRGNNPIFHNLIGGKKNNTRRCFLLIPATGEQLIIAHVLDRDLFTDLGIKIETYSGFDQLAEMLKEKLNSYKKIAMEYSPNGALPMISWVDAGTVEFIRSLGTEIVSSANLFQATAAVWSEQQYKSHLAACEKVVEIKNDAFKLIKNTIAAGGKLSEYDVKKYILERFEKAKLINVDGPVVAVEENSGNPHYEPTAENHKNIGSDNAVLIDLWAREKNENGIFCDITWVGHTSQNPSNRYMEIFNLVKSARDAVVSRLKTAWKNKDSIMGFELDDVARRLIKESAYGYYFVHRTGHSLGGGDHPHGLGANLDNFETHDTRSIIPGTGFTIEPGIYLPEFGVRSEINVYVDPVLGPTVTTPAQEEILILT